MLEMKVGFGSKSISYPINGNGRSNKGGLGELGIWGKVRLTLVAFSRYRLTTEGTRVQIRAVAVTHIILDARSLPLMTAISLLLWSPTSLQNVSSM